MASARHLKSSGPFLLLLAVAFLVYANTFGNGWTYDDFPVIVENPDVRSWAGFFKDSYPGRPLRELSYLLDYTLFGMNPAGWHIQQIFWHALNGCLVFALGRRLQMPIWFALISALLFLLHPLQVEVVANLSHRKDSLALAGSLGAILFYLKVFTAESRRLFWLIPAVLCWVVALYAKQTAVLVPLICLGGERLLAPYEKRVFLRYPRALFGLCVLGLGGASWWLAANLSWEGMHNSMRGTLALKANYFEPVTLVVYYLTVLKSWVFMALRLVWPFDLALEYTFPVPGSFFDPWVLAGFALCIIVLVWGCLAFRRWPTAGWLLGAALCLFLPTANIWPLAYLAADRYLYAPMAFLALLTGSALTRVPVRRDLVVSVSLVVLLSSAMLTWQQNRVWESPKTLWTQALRVNPGSSFVLNNMGNLALEEGDTSRARDYYRRAAQVNPVNPTAHYNLGWLAEQRRDIPAALKHYRAFAALDNPAFSQQLQELRVHLLRNYGVRL